MGALSISPMVCSGGARSFARAISGFSWAPGSARVREGYQGPRKEAQRFEYSENSRAGFVEFAPKCHPTNQQFLDELGRAPGVQRVEWKSSKMSQNNAGNHHMERNINVYVQGFPNAPLEFELTRNKHMKAGANCPSRLPRASCSRRLICMAMRGASSCM